MPAGHHPVLWVDRAAVVSLPAQVDAGNADDTIACLLSVTREGAAVVIVDMTATTFCDCAAAGGLVQAWKRARASGAGLRLAGGGPAVRRVLELTGVGRLIGTYPNVPEALIAEPARPSSLARPGSGPARHRVRLRLSHPRRPVAEAAHR